MTVSSGSADRNGEDSGQGLADGTRGRLERLLDDEIETYTALLRDAARATKRVRQNLACSKCGYVSRKEFTVRDFGPGLKSLELVLDRVEGRASQQAAVSPAASFSLVNRIVLAVEGGDAFGWLDERGLLSRPRAEVEKLWSDAHSTSSARSELPDTE